MYSHIITLILCLAFITDLSAKTITLCYDHFPPSAIFTTNESKHRGFTVDLITNIFEKAGFNIEYVEAPYARSVKMVENGYCDIQAEMAKHVDFKGLYFPKEGTFKFVYSAYTGQDNPIQINNISSMKGLRIANIPGYIYEPVSIEYHEFLQQLNKKKLMILTGEQASERILKMLSLQRVDIFVESDMVVENYIKNNPDIKVRKLFTIGMLKPYPGFSKVSKRSEKLMKIWDKGRAEAQASGLDLDIKKKSLEANLR